MPACIGTAIGEKFKASDKAEIANLMSSFMNLKYKTILGVRNFILKKIHIATRLK